MAKSRISGICEKHGQHYEGRCFVCFREKIRATRAANAAKLAERRAIEKQLWPQAQRRAQLALEHFLESQPSPRHPMPKRDGIEASFSARLDLRNVLSMLTPEQSNALLSGIRDVLLAAQSAGMYPTTPGSTGG